VVEGGREEGELGGREGGKVGEGGTRGALDEEKKGRDDTLVKDECLAGKEDSREREE